MGAEWVSELSTHNQGVEAKASAPISYQKLFEDVCPWYMSIGMSYDEFWYGKPERAKFYRKAHELKRRQTNEQLYIQGMYFFEALCNVAPVLVSMPKKDAKIVPYPSEPYPLTKEEQKEREKREIERKQKQAVERFAALATVMNQKFKKGGGKNG